MMKFNRLFSEPWLYVIAMILALAVRLVNLGVPALTNGEAAWALQALDSVRGRQPLIGSQAGYVQLTTLLFFIFSPTTFLARLWPAILGSLLVLVPILARNSIGRRAALILAFGLALDPGLAAISRQAGGAMLAVAGGWLALVLWRTRRPALAGICLAVALMSGEGFWLGLVGLGLALGAARLLKTPTRFPPDEAAEIGSQLSLGGSLRSLGFALAAAILLIGSLLFFSPRGLSGSLSGLPVFLIGWSHASGVSAGQVFAALLVYQPLAVIFGLIGGIRSWRRVEPFDRLLSLWTLASFLLVLVYPSRQASGLCWTLLPLWILAARQVARYLVVDAWQRLPVLSLAGLTVIIAIFTWLNLLSISNGMLNHFPVQNRWLAFALGLVIVLIGVVLAFWGWSAEAAGKGITWGICLSLVLYLVLSTTYAANLRPTPTPELWSADAYIPEASRVVKILDFLSDTHAGRTGSLDIAVLGVPSPALRWTLRNYAQTTFTDQIASGVMPAIVITPQEKEPGLAASYRGEGFLWYQTIDWPIMLDSEYLTWFVQRQAAQQKIGLVLWARTDLFPDFQAGSSTNQTILPGLAP